SLVATCTGDHDCGVRITAHLHPYPGLQRVDCLAHRGTRRVQHVNLIVIATPGNRGEHREVRNPREIAAGPHAWARLVRQYDADNGQAETTEECGSGRKQPERAGGVLWWDRAHDDTHAVLGAELRDTQALLQIDQAVVGALILLEERLQIGDLCVIVRR